MNLRELAKPVETAIETATPLGKARLIAGAVGILIVLGLLIWGGVWLKARLGDGDARVAAQSKIDGAVANAVAGSNDFAAAKLIEHTQTNTEIKEKEIHYVETIRAAPGADAPVPVAVHDAGIAAIRGLRDASADSERPAAAVPDKGS